MRLIDADALESKLRTLIKRITPIEDSRDMFYHDSGINGAITGAILEVKKATTIDPESLRPKGEWISVEDKKPDRFLPVIVYEPDFGVGEAEWDGRKFHWASDEGIAFATHWMSLPEPPNTEVPHDS